MKKVGSVLFLVYIAAMLLGCGVNTAKKCADVYTGYGAGLKGFILTVWDSVQESSISRNVAVHNCWIDLNGGIQRIVGTDVILDGERSVYRFDQNKVTFLNGQEGVQYSQANINGIRAMKAAAEDVGAQSIFISVPRKSCEKTVFSARGAVEHFPEWMKTDNDTFRANGYSVLDLHQKMHAHSADYSDLYYRTDHHWNVYGALFAAREVARAMGIEDSLLQANEFSVEAHPRFFLGSEGRHCGRLYCGMDDLDLLIPQFDTDMTLVTEKGIRRGTFNETIFFREYITKDYYNKDPYSVFLGPSKETTIINNRCADGKRVLMIKDSYAVSMAPYLALLCRQVDLLDLRFFKGSVSEYIQQEKPDIFCIMISPYTGKRYAEIQ